MRVEIENIKALWARSKSPWMRAFLDWVDLKWYIESKNNCGGVIINIDRDKYKIPIGFEVVDDNGKEHYILAKDIFFFEPWDNFVSRIDEYL